MHQARVTGYHPLDGILQLSLRPSVLSQKFLRVDDVQVGELVRGTVRRLTESALFVQINGSVDGMIWPPHYADILLKHPQKRFKAGATVKCRVSEHISLNAICLIDVHRCFLSTRLEKGFF